MKRQQASQVAIISMLFATMLVIEIVSQMIFQVLPLPVKPTLTFIPVIVGGILFGPKVGMSLGGAMGIMSVIRNTLMITPASYLFSPFVPGGSWASLIIAILPRVLIGLVPYLAYRWLNHRIGLYLAGALGALTNTVFVLSGFALFFNYFNGSGQAILLILLSSNTLLEILIAAMVTGIIVPRLEHLKK